MRTMTEEFVERARKEKQARIVKTAMGKLHFNFEQTCDFLEIPKEDRPELEKLIAHTEQSAVPESQSNSACSSEYESVPVYRRSMVDQAADQLIGENFEAFQKLGK